MNRTFIFGLLILLHVNSFSQNFDLLVADGGDSIAGKMESISDLDFNSQEYFDEINYHSINASVYDFEKGAIIIDGYVANTYPRKYPGNKYLETASQDELNFYLSKAKYMRSTGKVITLIGIGSLLSGFALISTGKEANGYLGFGMSIIGSGITVFGLPFFIVGSSRTKFINNILNSNDKSGLTMELGPCSLTNYQDQIYNPGISLRIRF